MHEENAHAFTRSQAPTITIQQSEINQYETLTRSLLIKNVTRMRDRASFCLPTLVGDFF